MIIDYNGKPIDFSPKFRRLVPVRVNTTDLFEVRHGMKETPTICRLEMSDGEVIMAVQCIGKDSAYVTFSTAPINALICFE